MLKCELSIFYTSKLTWLNASVFQHNLMLHVKTIYEYLGLCEAGSRITSIDNILEFSREFFKLDKVRKLYNILFFVVRHISE